MHTTNPPFSKHRHSDYTFDHPREKINMSSVGTQSNTYPDALKRLPTLVVSPPENPAQAPGIDGGILAASQKRGLPALKSPNPLRTMHLFHYIVGFALALWGLGVPYGSAAFAPSMAAVSWAAVLAWRLGCVMRPGEFG